MFGILDVVVNCTMIMSDVCQLFEFLVFVDYVVDINTFDIKYKSTFANVFDSL